ncbi:hypothetical protein [uncultured Nisaea sp.]|uniref:hypothetical protein n=1 Tax=uncultured Nisaea sp. TaxID=538215 RepID=UPI0030ED21AA
MSSRADIPEAFARPIADRLGHLAHAGTAPASDAPSIIVEADGMSLTLTLENASETVAQAHFSAPPEAPESAVLDLLCAHALGAPVREVVEHGLVFALQALRDPDAPAPVAGIVTPRNAGACFAIPLRLVAAVRREAEARFGRHADTNFFDRPYSDAWKKLDKAGKRDLLLPHIARFKADNGISDSAFELVEIDQYDRLFLVFTDEIAVWDKPVLLMKMERWLREQTGERIELFTEVVKDANRIRRL